MWYDAGKYEGLSQSRHACQDSDRMSSYGWTRHNAKDFGQQVCLLFFTLNEYMRIFPKFLNNSTSMIH